MVNKYTYIAFSVLTLITGFFLEKEKTIRYQVFTGKNKGFLAFNRKMLFCFDHELAGIYLVSVALIYFTDQSQRLSIIILDMLIYLEVVHFLIVASARMQFMIREIR